MAFDLLFLAYENLMSRPFSDRREALREVVSFHLPHESEAVDDECRELVAMLG